MLPKGGIETGLYIDGIFDDERIPLKGYIDLRLHFADRNLTVTMPRDTKPYYAEYDARYMQIVKDGQLPQIK